jgi:hypothetical protein
MRLWTAHCAASREAAQKPVSSRKFVRESITKSLAYSARKSPKQPERENITDLTADLQAESSLISNQGTFFAK